MKFFNFIVSSVIIAHHSVLTPQLAKHICLFVHLMDVNSNWTDTQKTGQEKGEAPLRREGVVEAQLPPQNLKIY